MRIEGKVREQNRHVYEIAFNKTFRDRLPSRPKDEYPLIIKIGTDEAVSGAASGDAGLVRPVEASPSSANAPACSHSCPGLDLLAV